MINDMTSHEFNISYFFLYLYQISMGNKIVIIKNVSSSTSHKKNPYVRPSDCPYGFK